MSRFVTRGLMASALFLKSLLWCTLVSAQYTNGTLGGTVTDPNGGAVTDARVTIRNQETGYNKTVQTGGDGAFLFPATPIGSYRLEVEKSGFSRFVQNGLTLALDQEASVPVMLRVGDVSQQVTIAGDTEMVNTRSATVGQLIDQQRIVDLPLNGRQPQALLFLAAGTVDETGKYCLVNCQGGAYPGEQDANVGGGGPRAVNYQMNGAGHNDTYLNTNLPFPNPDAVQEFNVQTDNLSAQYGQGAGAIVNVVTKSGTNSLHGTLFEFVRNGDLNARNFFAPRQDTLKRNQYGGSVGGPVLKDKLFYFGTYQGTKIRSAAQGKVGFVPTAAQRSGDFSAVATPLHDPITGALFPGNQIPTSLFSVPSLKLLQSIPLPNGPNGTLTFSGASLVQNDDQWMGKVDYLHGRSQLSGSYFWTRLDQPPDIAVSKQDILAADNSGNQLKIRNLAVNHVFTLSPSVIFQTWFGWDSQTGGSRSGAPYAFSDLGVNIAAPTPPELVVNVNGFFSISTNHLGNFNRSDYTVREDVAIQHGAHELHIGGEAVRVANDLVNTFTMSGQFTFGNQLSGNNLSDFLLGDASRFLQGGGEFKRLSGALWSLYVQDNWRLTPKLTVNLGLRWDPDFPYTEQDGRVPCFVPGAQSKRFPNAPVGLIFGGKNHDAGCPAASGYKTDLSNFGPRAGFAYRADRSGKTAVRGGFGLFYSPLGNHDSNGLVDTAPFGPRFDYSGTLRFADPFGSIGIKNPFPAQYGPSLPGPDAQFTLPVSIYGTIQKNWHRPELATWNLSFEHQFANDWLARIAYTGNKGTYLASGALSFREANPAVYIPGASTKANTQSRRLYPQFGSVGLFTSDNNSNYEALKFNIEKRFAKGFSILANYTWSKMIDDFGNSGTTDPFNRRFDYGTSNDDVPHVFHFSGVYQIPRLSLNRFAGAVVNGWGLTGLATWRAGFPFSVLSGVDNSFSGVGNDRADYLGGNAGLDSGRSHGALVSQYFNTSVFVPNAPGTFGSSGKNILRAPRLFDADFGLLRTGHVSERVSVQFRAEFFNAFNNVNLSGPGTTLGSSSFGRITSAGDPRILQLALKLVF
ncbi:MAG: carboxypeptidase regulatory-like domain-containing protein [Acidobacteriota bacterium]|nr:carboxypeptidase regulatory-like domain-containing protein [Acidobacteriota bacterium]